MPGQSCPRATVVRLLRGKPESGNPNRGGKAWKAGICSDFATNSQITSIRQTGTNSPKGISYTPIINTNSVKRRILKPGAVCSLQEWKVIDQMLVSVEGAFCFTLLLYFPKQATWWNMASKRASEHIGLEAHLYRFHLACFALECTLWKGWELPQTARTRGWCCHVSSLHRLAERWALWLVQRFLWGFAKSAATEDHTVIFAGSRTCRTNRYTGLVCHAIMICVTWLCIAQYLSLAGCSSVRLSC